jgi:thymidylate synthase (FAD)
MRHRVSWQELSRRYVSGNKQPFEFYASKSLKEADYCDSEGDVSYDIEDIYDMQIQHYNGLIYQGVKPQDARGILPQTMYTEVWSAWYPSQLESFINLRIEAHAQNEIRELALTKQRLVQESK